VKNDLPDLPPFTPGELELMWKYAPPCGIAQMSSVKPKIMQIRDTQMEVVESDSELTRFTPEQVANLWSATMEMQREAYAAYQSQQEQPKSSEAESTCSTFTQTSSAPSQDSED